MADKYRYTPAQIFKLRMQYKVQFNKLRNTFSQIVIDKTPHQRKHFINKIPYTAILPQQQRSVNRENPQKRHYSPNNLTQGIQRSISVGKRQFNTKSIDNLSLVLRQKCRAKKKSLSQVLSSKNNSSMIQLSPSKGGGDYLRVGMNDKSLTTIPKSSIKIIQKYHKFDDTLIG